MDPFDFDENKTNIIPRMDANILYEGYEHVLSHVYSPTYVYERAKTFMQEYQGANVEHPISRGIRFRDIGTIFRVVFHIGILGKERIYFWKLLLWTRIYYPKRIRLAFLFAVLIYQFRRMYERYEFSTPIGSAWDVSEGAEKRYGAFLAIDP